jgi:hypothetical protein
MQLGTSRPRYISYHDIRDVIDRAEKDKHKVGKQRGADVPVREAGGRDARTTLFTTV